MDQIKIGRFVAETRRAKGLTQRQLADQLSISDKTISKWETGVSHRSRDRWSLSTLAASPKSLKPAFRAAT